jgi:hypothetical protein
MELREDRALDEIRELRRQVSEACGHDAALLVERYLRLQEQYANRLLRERQPADLLEHDAA